MEHEDPFRPPPNAPNEPVAERIVGRSRPAWLVPTLVLCALVAIAVVIALTSPRPAAAFECYRAPPVGPFRECARELSRCDSQGCFQRATAFCFSSVTVIGGRQVICTPTREECHGWRLDHVTNRGIDSRGVCFEAGADEVP